MVSPNVNRILKQTETLTDAEREQLCSLLAERSTRQEGMAKQQQVRQALLQRGLLEPRSPQGKDLERFRRWQPIPIKGKPLSETIIEERR